MKIKTVLINRNGSPVLINQTDFRYGSDRLWEEGQEDVQPEEPAEIEAAPNTVKITHKGGGRWVVEVNGEAVHDDYLKKSEAEKLAADY